MEQKRGNKLSILAAAALALGISTAGCATPQGGWIRYQFTASPPYAGEVKPKPGERRIVHYEGQGAPYTVEECGAFTYAHSAGESMRRDGNTRTVVHCRPLHDPRNTSTEAVYDTYRR